MIYTNNPAMYGEALNRLHVYAESIGRAHRGRFVQIFLGMKYFQNEIPSMFSGQFIEAGPLQTLLDDLYTKASRPPTASILMLFEGRYLPRTGIRSPGRNYPQNTWRNNFNLQKGIGCYAPPVELASQTFLEQDRVDCNYLISPRNGSLQGARCRLCPGASYRSESHAKWLRIDPGGNGYAVADLLNINNYLGYVAPDGNRIPILPLVVALYHDAMPGLTLGSRTALRVSDFATDFNFTASELMSYFDLDPSNQHNRTMLRRFPRLSFSGTPQPVTRPIPRRPPPSRSPNRGTPTPIFSATPIPPPATNSGWDAQEYVASALRGAGWIVHDVSRQQLGYDLHAVNGRETRYVDAKSSLGYCRPVLTSREWQQANLHGSNYVLAILENFNPTGPNSIFWVPDPAGRCVASASNVIQYGISRSSWQANAVQLASI